MSSRGSRSRRAAAILGSGALAVSALLATTVTAQAAGTGGPARAASAQAQQGDDPGAIDVIPAPRSVRQVPGEDFEIDPATVVVVPAHDAAARDAAAALTGALRPSTGYPLPVLSRGSAATPHAIRLRTTQGGGSGAEGYRLDATHGGLRITAHTGAGLFYGVQTLLQLLPGRAMSDTVQPGPWSVPGVHISDAPRFAWRGAMLDVARHFFSVGEVERYLDLLAEYKVNVLHLHLADDQGWRIQIKGWPRLTSYGGSTEVGGGPGGYYTQEDFSRLVDYARQRHIMIVPEIDMPGHVNAALASYPELNCDGQAPPLYTGTEVGFSSLCIDKPITYQFLDDVIGQLAELSPSPFLHMGGDEAHSTPHDDYVTFVNRVSAIVAAHGKRPVGWEEIAGAEPGPTAVGQHWWDEAETQEAVAKGMDVIMSPAEKAYIDMQYDENSPLGLHWAGYSTVEDSYSWDPGSWVEGVPESSILGVEAPLWAETLEDIDDIEFMAFPRMAGIAERGWSPAQGRSWAEYRQRLGTQASRWDAQSVNFYRSPEVPWVD